MFFLSILHKTIGDLKRKLKNVKKNIVDKFKKRKQLKNKKFANREKAMQNKKKKLDDKVEVNIWNVQMTELLNSFQKDPKTPCTICRTCKTKRSFRFYDYSVLDVPSYFLPHIPPSLASLQDTDWKNMTESQNAIISTFLVIHLMKLQHPRSQKFYREICINMFIDLRIEVTRFMVLQCQGTLSTWF